MLRKSIDMEVKNREIFKFCTLFTRFPSWTSVSGYFSRVYASHRLYIYFDDDFSQWIRVFHSFWAVETCRCVRFPVSLTHINIFSTMPEPRTMMMIANSNLLGRMCRLTYKKDMMKKTCFSCWIFWMKNIDIYIHVQRRRRRRRGEKMKSFYKLFSLMNRVRLMRDLRVIFFGRIILHQWIVVIIVIFILI